MAYNRRQARALSNDSEYELFSASLADAIGKLTPTQLRAKIKRARALRDKSTDLFRRQSLAMQETSGSKRGRTGAANERTEQKARLFDETLKRFEARLAKLEAGLEAAAPKASSKSAGTGAPAAKPVARRTTPKDTTARADPAAPPARKPAGRKASATPPASASPAKPRSAKTATKAAAGKGPAGVSPTLKVRSKVQAAHTRSATARRQAKRDKR